MGIIRPPPNSHDERDKGTRRVRSNSSHSGDRKDRRGELTFQGNSDDTVDNLVTSVSCRTCFEETGDDRSGDEYMSCGADGRL